MAKTISVFKKTGVIFGRDGEWDGDEGYYIDHEVSDEKWEKAIINIADEVYFDNKLNHKNFRKFLIDFDLFNTLEEGFEEELKEYFQEEFEKEQRG